MTKKLWVVGLAQALGVIIYCGLISGLFQLLEKTSIQPPAFLGMAFMLMLLVFSAAVSGALVFGYPVYLAINKDIKSALRVLLFTFLFLILLAVVTVGTIMIF